MKLVTLLLNFLVIFNVFFFVLYQQAASASWTMLVYIAADNDLAPFASYNIKDMSSGFVLSKNVNVNVLVQWDKPDDNKTWRYKITPGRKIDVGTLSSEMGYNPEIELVNAMQWAVKNYPANNYALILWDHGSGIEDFYPGVATRGIHNNLSWLYILPRSGDRGILYDYSQKTCLTNQGLTNALTKIKQILGKKLDLIAMDACLMAMVEVAYQMKDLVTFFVGSQQTIPGNGFPYSKFIKPLSAGPLETTPVQLAQNMVSSYKAYYTSVQPTADFTLSTINVGAIDLIKQNIDQFISAVAACCAIDAVKTKNIITMARRASLFFEMPEYIDLYSFYTQVINQIKKISPKSSLILAKQNITIGTATNPAYQKSLIALTAILQDGLAKISKIVLQKAAGPVYGGVQGISIYYPSNGIIDDSYKNTIFAQNTAWMQFIQLYHY